MDEKFAQAFSSAAQQCPLRTQWVSFRLVDEFGNGAPYAGLPYQLVDKQGEKYTGLLDGDGYVLIENIYCGAALLTFPEQYKGGVDTWYERLMIRENYALPITALQVAAEQTLRRPTDQPSPSPTRAAREKGEFYRVEVRDLVEVASHLPPASTILSPRPSTVLAANAGQGQETTAFGVALAPNKHHVLEVKTLRAWRPLLSLTPEFSALDAYQLALFTTLAYADFGQAFKEGQPLPPKYPVPGTVGHVLNARLGNIQTGELNEEPSQFGAAKDFHPILEDVPYSKRLEVVPYDPQRYTKQEERKQPWELHSLNDLETNTQAYISHDDRMILIGIRGTQENPPDLWRDIDAAQVPYKEGVGQAHQGFYNAFLAVKKFVTPYLDKFYTGQKIVVCGHSLGGAIALLLAEWIRREFEYDVLLYTYGAPRAGDEAFVKGAAELVHHRLVNHNDPIPSVPATWMDTDKRLLVTGAAALITGASGVGGAAFLAGAANFKGDAYQHHGTQHHFLPLTISKSEETSVLWQPDCEGIEDAACAYYSSKVGAADMPDRAAFISQLWSIGLHFMATGYVPACHATLLRWKTSSETVPGTYLTAREQLWLQQEIESYRSSLEAWEQQAWRHYDAAHRHEGGSIGSRREDFERSIGRANAERRRLPRTLLRIETLAQQRISKTQLYGAQAENPQLESLVARWQEHERNKPSKAPKHARLPVSNQTQYA